VLLPTKFAFWTKRLGLLLLTHILLIDHLGQLSTCHLADHVDGISVYVDVLKIEVSESGEIITGRYQRKVKGVGVVDSEYFSRCKNNIFCIFCIILTVFF